PGWLWPTNDGRVAFWADGPAAAAPRLQQQGEPPSEPSAWLPESIISAGRWTARSRRGRLSANDATTRRSPIWGCLPGVGGCGMQQRAAESECRQGGVEPRTASRRKLKNWLNDGLQQRDLPAPVRRVHSARREDPERWHTYRPLLAVGTLAQPLADCRNEDAAFVDLATGAVHFFRDGTETGRESTRAIPGAGFRDKPAEIWASGAPSPSSASCPPASPAPSPWMGRLGIGRQRATARKIGVRSHLARRRPAALRTDAAAARFPHRDCALPAGQFARENFVMFDQEGHMTLVSVEGSIIREVSGCLRTRPQRVSAVVWKADNMMVIGDTDGGLALWDLKTWPLSGAASRRLKFAPGRSGESGDVEGGERAEADKKQRKKADKKADKKQREKAEKAEERRREKAEERAEKKTAKKADKKAEKRAEKKAEERGGEKRARRGRREEAEKQERRRGQSRGRRGRGGEEARAARRHLPDLLDADWAASDKPLLLTADWLIRVTDMSLRICLSPADPAAFPAAHQRLPGLFSDKAVRLAKHRLLTADGGAEAGDAEDDEARELLRASIRTGWPSWRRPGLSTADRSLLTAMLFLRPFEVPLLACSPRLLAAVSPTERPSLEAAGLVRAAAHPVSALAGRRLACLLAAAPAQPAADAAAVECRCWLETVARSPSYLADLHWLPGWQPAGVGPNATGGTVKAVRTHQKPDGQRRVFRGRPASVPHRPAKLDGLPATWRQHGERSTAFG
uniref:WD_REPEATS_REGION domain-containing protein n=1 Tax=Macrostomum lignano TaxID=282301 RepID=A0A1I8FNT1_9PLAT